MEVNRPQGREPGSRAVRALLIVLLAPAIVTVGVRAEEEPLPDPVPIRRVLLPATKLAAELARDKDGVLVRMSRREFEQLVQKAAAVQKGGQSPPQLIEARYRASFSDSQELVGTAQWKVVHRGKGAALLRLTGEGNAFNLAVRQPRFENREALLTFVPDAEGKSRAPTLLIDRPGDHTVTLEWSARTESRPTGLFVDLRLPECPAASLELELPAEFQLSLLDGSLVSGPHPAQAAGRRLWRVPCGGKTQLLLLLRRTGEGRPAPVLLAWQKVVQRLSPEGLETSSSFDLQSLHQDVRELTVEFDALLRPVEVTAPALHRWTVEPTAVGQPGRLVIQLSRPLREGVVELRCVAPLTAQLPRERRAERPLLVPWVSPALRIRGAVPRGETIELLLHPELRLLSWQAGDFRLLDSSPVPDGPRGIGQRRLTLQGGGIAQGVDGKPAAQPRRPSGMIQTGGVEFRVRQQSLWRLGSESQELNCQIEYDVRQGQLFQPALRLPADWEVEAVELNPSEVLRSWGVRGDRGGPLLLVDLRRPLRAGTTEAAGVLTVRLRRPGAFVLRDLNFPDLVPVGSHYREGGFGIDFDEQVYQANVRTPLSVADAGGTPIAKVVPDYYYPFRGEEVVGTLRLDPRPSRFRTQVRTQVYLGGERGAVETKIELTNESGSPASLDLHLSADGEQAWEWHLTSAGTQTSGRPLRAERLMVRELGTGLASLAASSPLGAAALAGVRLPGAVWRVHLDRPLAARQKVTLQATRVLRPHGEGRWEVPLVSVLNQDATENEVHLHLAGVDLSAVERVGLSEFPLLRSREGEPTLGCWRAYRYTLATPRLVLQMGSSGVGPLAEAAIDRARLTSLLTPDGELRHHFRFRLSRWPRRTLPIQMPAQTTLLAVAVAEQWLEHGAMLDENRTLNLPTPSGAGPFLYEILYTTPAPRNVGALRLRAVAPELPVSPLVVQRRWLLPDGIVPVGDSGALPLPGNGAGVGTRSAGSRLLSLMRIGPQLPMVGRLSDTREEHQRMLVEVCGAITAELGDSEQYLGRLVYEMLGDYLPPTLPLVVDRVALQRARLTPTSVVMIRSPFEEGDTLVPWIGSELVLHPTRTGVLLTTDGQREEWSGDELPPSVEAALARCVERGRDLSGRFVTALEWLGPENAGRILPTLLRASDDPRGRQGWQPVTGANEESLLVVRRELMTIAGLLLAGSLVAGFLLLRDWSETWRWRLLLLVLAVSGVSLAWLPSALTDLAWFPLLAGLALAFPWYLMWAARPAPTASTLTRMPTSRSSIVRSSVGTGAVLLLLSVAGSQAQPTRPAEPMVEAEVVLLVAEGADPAGAVLVRPRLLKKLEALARPVQIPGSGVVLVSAAYEGKLEREQASFTARFEAYVFGGEPVTLEIPLEDVQLTGDVLVDGARVLPVALAPPRSGFAMRLMGEGRHRVELRFLTTAQRAEDDLTWKVRVGIPSLVQSRVSFAAPETARNLRVPIKHGSQRVVAENGGQRLEAELGAISAPLHIRWYEEPRPARAPRVEYREAYLWDLRVDASLLTGLVNYTIRDGGVSSLRVDIPPELEPRSVEARRPSAENPGGMDGRTLLDPIRLSDWILEGSGATRGVRLDFPQPISGPVEVTLELVPVQAWAANVLLPLPRPHGEPDPRTPGYLAYRHQGMEVTRTNWLRLTGIRGAEFAPFWPEATRPAAAVLDYASSFRRDAKLPPELRLQMRAIQPRLEATQEMQLQVGVRRAEWTARVDLVAPGKDLSVVEYLIESPRPVTVATVTGPDVGRWSQTGQRLLIWLEKTTGSTRMEFSGWVPLEQVPTRTRPGQVMLSRLDLPCLRLVPGGTVQTLVVLRPQAGLRLREQGLRGLTAEPRPTTGEPRYTTREASFGGTFLVQPGPAATVEVVTRVRLENRELVWESDLGYRVQGEQRTVQVRLRDWAGDAWLDVLSGQVTRRREEHQRTNGRRERSWTLELAGGGLPRFQLRGRLPLEDDSPVELPEVQMPGAQVRQTIRLESGLSVERQTGLTAKANATNEWAVTGESWSLRVRPQEQARSAPVEVALGALRAVATTGEEWLYEARYTLRQQSPAELRIPCPEGVELLSMHLDERLVTVREVENGSVSLPLSGPPGMRELVIRYRRVGETRGLEHPDLTPLHLEGVRSGPLLWTVDVPAGWEVVGASGGSRLGAGVTRTAVLQLHQAELWLAQCRDLIERQRMEEVPTAQRRFAQAMSLVVVALRTGAEARRRLGPDGRDLSGWQQRLQEQMQTLEKEHQLDAPSSRTEEVIPIPEPLPILGTPMSWQQEDPSEEVMVRLAPVSRRERQQAVAFTGQWLVLLLVLSTLTMSAGLRTVARWVWPEQVMLLAVVGWHLAGPTLPVVALLTLGVVARGVILVRGLRGVLRQGKPATIFGLGGRGQ